jgi:adsorption protein B
MLLTWLVALIFVLSGGQDLIYDIGLYTWRIFHKLRYGKRDRLTLAKLRARTQQRIAVFIPAWNEGEVVRTMVDNLLHRVDYNNYTVFVGTYPNDPVTQHVVEVLAAAHPQLVKVVTTRPGPTSKADCLNHVFKAMQAYEQRHGVNFDIMVMHDAEDVVHPYSFLLYNYLLPRVDVVQLPVLPLPTEWNRWIHWVYADEFCENHLKDVPVRERLSGFVPFAGTGTGFARRVLTLLEDTGHGLFNEASMTEDYSLSKKIRALGCKTIFLTLVLGDDTSPWYTPLCRRESFIANWAFFPMDFVRSVKQKSRWILGISLQEWEQTGWAGDWRLRENLVKDRKVFAAAAASLLAYGLLLYFIIYALGERGVLPFRWLPFIFPHTPLYTLVLVDTALMLVRLLERVLITSTVYGVGAGLLAIPRLAVANVVNGLAAFRALQAFLLARMGKAGIRWDKTDHTEGVGELPSALAAAVPAQTEAERSLDELEQDLASTDAWIVLQALEALPRHLPADAQNRIRRMLGALVEADDHHIRALVARTCGRLHWPGLEADVLYLLQDSEWVVRANAAIAAWQFPQAAALLAAPRLAEDSYAWEALVRALEGQDRIMHSLLDDWASVDPTMQQRLLRDSFLLRHRFMSRVETPGQPQTLTAVPTA